MNLFEEFSQNSKVWVYASDRVLTDKESQNLMLTLSNFTNNWKSHQLQLKAKAQLLFNAIVVIMVDESMHTASGCSIDKSIAAIKDIGNLLNVNFFNRMLIYAIRNNNLHILNIQQLKEAIAEQTISPDSEIINPLVQTKQDFDTNFRIKLKNSWASKYLMLTSV